MRRHPSFSPSMFVIRVWERKQFFPFSQNDPAISMINSLGLVSTESLRNHNGPSSYIRSLICWCKQLNKSLKASDPRVSKLATCPPTDETTTHNPSSKPHTREGRTLTMPRPTRQFLRHSNTCKSTSFRISQYI